MQVSRNCRLIFAVLVCIFLYIVYNHSPTIGNWVTRLAQPRKQRTDRELIGNITSSNPRPVVFWSNDYHISPIQDLKSLLKPLGVEFIDKSLSGHCYVTGTCDGKKNLRVINQGNAMNLDPALIPLFYQAYKDSPLMRVVDAFVCYHPTAMCELFEPFNRSMIIVASTRYEIGRLDAFRWQKWNNNLLRYSRDPKNVIGANNLYDAEYIKYFTGIAPVLLPSLCDYNVERYNPTRPGFLLAPMHNRKFEAIFLNDFANTCKKLNCSARLSKLRDLYAHYKYSDLTSHLGIVYVPYQVSVMSFFEQYRMQVPLFCPSVELLSQWQFDHQVMNERTWDGVFGGRPSRSKIDPHPTQQHRPDPNNDRDLEAIKYWVKYADFYQFPHVILYNSVEDLIEKLQSMTVEELRDISKAMAEYNVMAKQDLIKKWKAILNNIVKYRRQSFNSTHKV